MPGAAGTLAVADGHVGVGLGPDRVAASTQYASVLKAKVVVVGAQVGAQLEGAGAALGDIAGGIEDVHQVSLGTAADVERADLALADRKDTVDFVVAACATGGKRPDGIVLIEGNLGSTVIRDQSVLRVQVAIARNRWYVAALQVRVHSNRGTVRAAALASVNGSVDLIRARSKGHTAVAFAVHRRKGGIGIALLCTTQPAGILTRTVCGSLVVSEALSTQVETAEILVAKRHRGVVVANICI